MRQRPEAERAAGDDVPGPGARTPHAKPARRVRWPVAAAAAVVAAGLATGAVLLARGPADNGSRLTTTSSGTRAGSGNVQKAEWKELSADPAVFPAGADVASVVPFDGRLVAAGAVFLSCGLAGEAACSTNLGPAPGQPGAASPVVWTSDNGRTWHRVWDAGGVVLGSDTVQHLVVVGDGLLLLDGGTAGTAAWTSGDGRSWARADLPAGLSAASLTDVVDAHGVIVAVVYERGGGGSAVWTSRDGRTWAPAATGFGPATTLMSVAATPAGFVAGGSGGPNGDLPVVWSSPDGSHWARTGVGGGAGSAVTAMGASGSTIVAVLAPAAGGAPGLRASRDGGATWQRVTGAVPGPGEGAHIVSVGGRLVLLPAAGTSVWSPGAGDWSPITGDGAPAAPASITAASAWNGRLLVVVDETGRPSYLQDGPRVWEVTLPATSGSR